MKPINKKLATLAIQKQSVINVFLKECKKTSNKFIESLTQNIKSNLHIDPLILSSHKNKDQEWVMNYQLKKETETSRSHWLRFSFCTNGKIKIDLINAGDLYKKLRIKGEMFSLTQIKTIEKFLS